VIEENILVFNLGLCYESVMSETNHDKVTLLMPDQQRLSCCNQDAGPASPFSPQQQLLLRAHFWCDFGDLVKEMVWDDMKEKEQ
jgi:hypothetical protein